MRRIGHSTDGFTPRQLEVIREISGTADDSLRRMHVENAPPPLLLDETLKRFRAFDDVGATSQQVRSGRPMDPSSYWFEQLVTELPGWPSDCALKVYEHSDFSGMARTYGSAVPPTRTLSLGLADVMAGKLPDNVVDFLDEAQLAQLLDSRLPKQQQMQALRDRLADVVDGRKGDISDYVYRFREASNHPRCDNCSTSIPTCPPPSPSDWWPMQQKANSTP